MYKTILLFVQLKSTGIFFLNSELAESGYHYCTEKCLFCMHLFNYRSSFLYIRFSIYVSKQIFSTCNLYLFQIMH